MDEKAQGTQAHTRGACECTHEKARPKMSKHKSTRKSSTREHAKARVSKAQLIEPTSTNRDVRKQVRALVPACTSPMRHMRVAKRLGHIELACNHTDGLRVVS